MKKFNLNELIEYNDSRFNPKVLINETAYRMVLMNLRQGQSVPEHANQSVVTVYALVGHVTFHGGTDTCELHAGEVVCLEPGIPHSLNAHEDTALFVIAAGKTRTPSEDEKLDLRDIPRPLRHPLVFAKLDAIAAGDSFVLVNDHDPVPLMRQIDSMRHGQAALEYIQRGPDIFRIRIRRIAPSRPSDVPVKEKSTSLVAEIGKA